MVNRRCGGSVSEVKYADLPRLYNFMNTLAVESG